ncbi:MAG: hypothetical protein QOF51_180 [Chloroflexota bacterium]|jgi:alkanesulfonate monooxygenase SsuD/methylene tetrahydromethanopterin reductase-like flavin-dependent oxidoreductase (luciferase family)|nr:hypothetical protein [Chloroflexota bacterium]
MSLAFGLLDAFNEPEMDGPQAAAVYEEHIRGAQEAEQLGYRYYFFIEHQNATFTCVTSSNVYLTAIARGTSAIRLGAMVYQLPLHHPIRLAQDAAMVDQLSGGRLEFGIGYGTRVAEFAPWRLQFEDRREMGVEVMDVVLKAWTEDRVTHEGRFWSFDDAMSKPRPLQQPHPPVWVGAHSPASFEYAADHNFHVGQNIDVDEVVAQKFAYWREQWAMRGHPGPRPMQLLARAVHVAETDEQARAEVEPALLRGMRGTVHVGTAQNRPAAERSATTDEFARVYQKTAESYDFWIDNGLAIVGSPDTVIRKLEEQQRFVGYDVFLASHRINHLPPELARSSIQLFGRHVLPAFARNQVAVR